MSEGGIYGKLKSEMEKTRKEHENRIDAIEQCLRAKLMQEPTRTSRETLVYNVSECGCSAYHDSFYRAMRRIADDSFHAQFGWHGITEDTIRIEPIPVPKAQPEPPRPESWMKRVCKQFE